MNIKKSGEGPDSDILYISFNQDTTGLAIGTKRGYKLYEIKSVDKFEEIYSHDAENVCIVQRLFSSSLVAYVSQTSPRRLKVCHFQKRTEICNYSYSNTVLAVKLNRSVLIVCLEESLYIHNIRDMSVIHTIKETPSNPQGLCALTTGNDASLLAYPGSDANGLVQIFDCKNLRNLSTITAHDNPLAALAFDQNGQKLATASEKGTVIRVYAVANGQRLFEFRRGVKRCVAISSLSFSVDSLHLAVSSNTETVHIFKLEGTQPAEVESAGLFSYFNSALKVAASYLPYNASDVLNQDRAFATVHLPSSGLKTLCGIRAMNDSPRVLVVAQDGFIYIYTLDPTEGGECVLYRQHNLADEGGSSQPSAAKPTQSSSANPSTQPRPSSHSNSSPFSSPPGSSPIKSDDGGPDLRLDDENEFPAMSKTDI